MTPHPASPENSQSTMPTTTPRAQDDFYRHVNAQWLEQTTIPDDKPAYAAFTVLRDEAQENLRDILEGLGDPAELEAAARLADASASAQDDATQHDGAAAQARIDQQLAAMYASYLDRARANELGLEPIRGDVERITAAQTIDELLAVFAALARHSKGTVVDFGVDADFDDTSLNRLFLDQALLGLPDRDYYLEDGFADARADYLDYLTRVFGTLGVEDPSTRAEELLAFETRVAGSHMSKVERRNPRAVYNPVSVVKLAESSPWLMPWLERVGFDAAELETVVVEAPSYLERLNTLLTEDNLEVLRLSALAQLFNARAAYLSEELAETKFDFYGRKLSGVKEQRPLHERAISLVEGTLGEALGQRYVKRYFKAESKAQMDELVAKLLEAYRTSLADLEWMSDATRAKALEKLATFTPKIGFPDRWEDYSALVVDPQDLVGNVERSAELEFEREHARLHEPVDKGRWHMTPQTINAYYHPLHNEIAFPAAILQPPFFDPQASDAQNYAAIGSVIGHEIGHGFDDQGSQFDGDGSLRDWWGEEDRARFAERTQALVGQYNALSPEGVPDGHVNGGLTLGENIGDLGGVTIALKAWRSALESAGLIGAEGPSTEQLQEFFESYARIWRAKARPEHAKMMLSIDPHSPSEFRANQVLRNIDAFHETYATRPGDGMWLEPGERVKIWY